MGVIVSFDYTAWVARYPEFEDVPQATAAAYFAEAGAYCANDGTGPINDPSLKLVYMNMLTAHIAAMNSTATGASKPANSPVGRLSDATEGSVSASFQNDYPPGTAQWYQQTRYGAAYWAATAQYRSFLYRPPTTFTGGPVPWPYPPRSL
ncbi:MAG: DUF4054 domain-containing protein [Alphaproteobacteria bacterium]|nr:DUF4054 domain-containing protein [Alphaproteobacteria bacterium]